MTTLPTLEVDQRGDVVLYMVWALRPGQPQIVAVCRSEVVAERYRPFVTQHHRGAVFYVEPVILDHLFARNDMQSAIYKAADARRAPHD